MKSYAPEKGICRQEEVKSEPVKAVPLVSSLPSLTVPYSCSEYGDSRFV
jgi:hypothetical protein